MPDFMKLLYRLKIVHDTWGDGPQDLYLRRIALTPRFKFGQLRIHIFYRGDTDEDPHDHRWDFWTIPLCKTGYLESAPDYNGILKAVHVPGFRLTKRPAEYAHLVKGKYLFHNGLPEVIPGTFATLVWIGPTRREWGFWPYASKAIELGMLTLPGWTNKRVFVPWKTYIAKRAAAYPAPVDK